MYVGQFELKVISIMTGMQFTLWYDDQNASASPPYLFGSWLGST